MPRAVVSVLGVLAAALLLPARPGAQPPADSAAAPARVAPAPPAPVVVLSAPGGDTLFVVSPAAPLQAVGREGEWTRVRIEGWTRTPIRGQGSGTPTNPLRGLKLHRLRAEPERYRGQALRWKVEFVALQRADSLRRDLAAGEAFILARDPDDEPGFVYLVVPPALLPAVQQLVPLQPVEVVGRVRTGSSALTGHPVLELLRLQAVPR